MPAKNRIKVYSEDSYYHAYNRGINKRRIFLDDDDYKVFLNLLKRHLSQEPQTDNKGREYKWLYNEIELLAYCLMPNHFHICLYQVSDRAMQQLIGPVSMSYTTYFNKKYGRIGPLFQDTYKASRISDDAYLQHISRYIHRNPKGYELWPYSSYRNYTGNKTADWVHPERLLALFDNKQDYVMFTADYEDYKQSLDTALTHRADK
jgi:putative transposase